MMVDAWPDSASHGEHAWYRERQGSGNARAVRGRIR